MPPHPLTDSWTMTRRELAHWSRHPAPLLIGLLFPVMLLLMFGYLMGGGRGVTGDYLDYLLPGMLALTMAFGLENTMAAVTRDLTKGVIDRFRSLPMSDAAVLVGRASADMLSSTLALTVLMTTALTLGWRPDTTPTNFLTALALLLLLRFAMLWIGIHLALIAGTPELIQTVQILIWPVAFLSNALAAPESMPSWLAAAVDWNPLSQTATAVRDLLGAPGAEASHTWTAVAWPLALLALFFPLAVRKFARLNN
ncbi:ABC transporter permease [Streptomyces roseirectus]|uniref:Transport permease protein n=1 Tax=Streptomyces roseirectus TaxID=2768066 RepID=A0A7H0IE24_9ACTN|nr:ABC transporter permease [Streptomyces roseirectus]QNP71040.1 ABC transporter permease [Streptomyces roseirectus]